MVALARRPAPPFQLLKGDRYNFTLGVLFVFGLGFCKDTEVLPPHVRWHFNAYTNWNLLLILLRLALGQAQWDPFLCVNSVGILVGFRTAMSQGLDENMRRKLASIGLPLSRPLFLLGDHACHSVPAAVLVALLARRRQKVPFVNAAYAMTLATWFAFRQQAKLDTSGIYVPHPWVRTWLGILTGVLATPPLVGSLGARRWRRAALAALALLVPWLSTRLDPGLRKKYAFEFAVAKAGLVVDPDAKRQASKPGPRMPRAASQPITASSILDD